MTLRYWTIQMTMVSWSADVMCCAVLKLCCACARDELVSKRTSQDGAEMPARTVQPSVMSVLVCTPTMQRLLSCVIKDPASSVYAVVVFCGRLSAAAHSAAVV